MMELADMQDLGSCASALGFKSPCPHQQEDPVEYSAGSSCCIVPFSLFIFQLVGTTILTSYYHFP